MSFAQLLLDPASKNTSVIGVRSHRQLPLQSLRKLALKLTVEYDALPTSFYLKGVKCVESESRGSGAFADLYLGEWNGQAVALKRLRVDTKDQDATEKLKRVRTAFDARLTMGC